MNGHLYKIGPLCDCNVEFRCRVSSICDRSQKIFFLKRGEQIRVSIALTNGQI